jgi:hypothetical protein
MAWKDLIRNHQWPGTSLLGSFAGPHRPKSVIEIGQSGRKMSEWSHLDERPRIAVALPGTNGIVGERTRRAVHLTGLNIMV